MKLRKPVSHDAASTAATFDSNQSFEGQGMTDTLAEKNCTPCRGGIAPLTHEEAERFQSQTPNWELRDDSHRIERTFRFRNFQEALGFIRNAGDLAETEGHHPDISFGWGYATIYQEDQGTARERFYHGEQDRPDFRSAGWPSRSLVRWKT
jgi:4a-hydroxytetrahydrobiopterin dehydratase